jgi:hypothetical protein
MAGLANSWPTTRPMPQGKSQITLAKNGKIEHLGCCVQAFDLLFVFISADSSHAANQGAEEACSELEFAALQAMSALLSCGPCFTNQGLCYEGIFYPWLDMMLDCSDEKVRPLFNLFLF